MTRIFLAASEELAADRKIFEQDIFRRDLIWCERGYRLQPTLWESFDDSMSATRKQDDYNAEIAKADIFVVLVHTKLGKYTREEFQVAWDHFNDSGKPLIYTYFKGLPEPGEPDPNTQYASVREFLAQLASMGHWPNKYDEPTQMLHHFATQIERLWAKGFIVPQALAPEPDAGKPKALIDSSNNRGNINMGNQRIDTGGGAFVMGGVTTKKFVGRDNKK